MASVHGARPSDPAQELFEPAWQMRWRVPELALVLGERAVAQARSSGDRTLRLRAEALALFAANRLGRGVAVTGRAIAAVRDAEAAGEHDVATELRVELACCARTAGGYDAAVRVLQPVLERERIEPALRAHALVELAAALPGKQQDGERAEALDEAERLYAAAAEPNRDTGRLLLARVHTARAGHLRRNGDFEAAVTAAEAGMALLERLGDPAAESGEIRARLVLERVHALLDLGRRSAAVEAAGPVIRTPVRAAAAGPSGWLRLALATRVHLPSGEHAAAVRLLNDAAANAERHRLDCLLAEALNMTSQAHERAEEFAEALACLRRACAADRRWRTAVHAARMRLLAEFPALAGRGAAGPAPWAVRGEPGGSAVPPVREAAESTGSARQEVTAQRFGAQQSGQPTGRRRADGTGRRRAPEPVEPRGSVTDFPLPRQEHRAAAETTGGRAADAAAPGGLASASGHDDARAAGESGVGRTGQDTGTGASTAGSRRAGQDAEARAASAGFVSAASPADGSAGGPAHGDHGQSSAEQPAFADPDEHGGSRAAGRSTGRAAASADHLAAFADHPAADDGSAEQAARAVADRHAAPPAADEAAEPRGARFAGQPASAGLTGQPAADPSGHAPAEGPAADPLTGHPRADQPSADARAAEVPTGHSASPAADPLFGDAEQPGTAHFDQAARAGRAEPDLPLTGAAAASGQAEDRGTAEPGRHTTQDPLDEYRRPGEGSVRDAARRLMETLTSRVDEDRHPRSAHHRSRAGEGMPSPRAPEQSGGRRRAPEPAADDEPRHGGYDLPVGHVTSAPLGEGFPVYDFGSGPAAEQPAEVARPSDFAGTGGGASAEPADPQQPPWRTASADEPERPDVTAIMPVIAVPEDDTAQPATGGQVGAVLPSSADQPAHAAPELDTPPPPPDSAADSESGRRTRGRSLAEIRESLAMQAQGQHGGRRAARRAAEDRAAEDRSTTENHSAAEEAWSAEESWAAHETWSAESHSAPADRTSPEDHRTADFWTADDPPRSGGSWADRYLSAYLGEPERDDALPTGRRARHADPDAPAADEPSPSTPNPGIPDSATPDLATPDLGLADPGAPPRTGATPATAWESAPWDPPGGPTSGTPDDAPAHAPDEPGSGRRHADATAGESAADLLARHRGAAAEPAGQDSADEVGLADLLAEALLAYENGRRAEGGRHGGESTSDASAPGARHRRSADSAPQHDSWTSRGH